MTYSHIIMTFYCCQCKFANNDIEINQRKGKITRKLAFSNGCDLVSLR